MFIQTVIKREEKEGNTIYVLYRIDEVLFQSNILEEVETAQKEYKKYNLDDGFYLRRS